MSVSVKDFKCSGCGTPLKIPKNSRGQVTCPSCKKDSVIEGLSFNAEMAAKENINSGYPLFAPRATLHRKLVSTLSNSPNLPLDVFEHAEVIREEHHCMPAYYFDCSATAHFNYEKGVDRTQVYTVDRGSYVETRERTYTDWMPANGSISENRTVFAPGNRTFVKQFQRLYGDFTTNKLIDFDSLEFPPDVETSNFDIPQIAAFNEFVTGFFEQLLREKAVATISTFQYQNFAMGGSPSIHKEMNRVFLGMYNVVFRYRDMEYSVWMSGDGEKVYHEAMPVDMQRKSALENKHQAMQHALASIPVPSTGLFTAGMWSAIGLAVVFLFLPTPINIIGLLLFTGGAITCGVLKSTRMKPYRAYYAQVQAGHQNDIAAFEGQVVNAVRQFNTRKQALRGIYVDLTGDASAFPAVQAQNSGPGQQNWPQQGGPPPQGQYQQGGPPPQ
ncbi:MAG: hypothetical protein FWG82_06920, partial [Oscillospiraceae bacterium]|nr:hypothetical protein [Oscillospiraceae bacterium]